MSNTVFGENFFSAKSDQLFETAAACPNVKQALAVERINHYPTYSHSKGVGRLVAEYAISGVVRLSPEKQTRLVTVALLHDLGKLSVSNTILDKQSRLIEEDWEQIEHHPIDGFHRYAQMFTPDEALPIMLHHTFQDNDYPPKNHQETALNIYDLPSESLNDDENVTNTIVIAVADHIEARFPIRADNSIAGIRKYSSRNYKVSDLPLLVRASFIEAGKVDTLGKRELLESLIVCTNDLLSKTDK